MRRQPAPDNSSPHVRLVDFRPGPAAAAKSADGRVGDSVEARLAALEARMEYLATKEDVQKLKVWVLGAILAAVSIAAAAVVIAAVIFN